MTSHSVLPLISPERLDPDRPRPGRIGSVPVRTFRTFPRDPSGGSAADAWRDLVDAPPEYDGISVTRDVKITMSDGTTIRAYVIRPADASGVPATGQFPTILNITPYNKLLIKSVDNILSAPVIGPLVRRVSAQFDLTGTPFDGITELTRVVSGGAADLLSVNRHLVRSGYVQVIADARGTGSSTGVWDILGSREQQDTLEIISWLRARSWCDGHVGMAGISYSAINSLQAAAAGPDGLDAVFAVEGSDDIVREIFATGGAPSLFIPLWLTTVNALKWVPSAGMKTGLGGWITSRLRSPATSLIDLASGFLFGADARIYDDPYYSTIDAPIENIDIPTFVYGCWHDIFGGAAPDIYNRLRLPRGRKQLLIGDGYHGNPGIGFGEPGFPPRLDVLERAWFDRWLRGIHNGIEKYGPVTLRQQGGTWKAHGDFPAPHAVAQRLYLSGDSSGTARHTAHDGSLRTAASFAPMSVSVRPGVRTVVSRDTTQVLAGVPAVLGGGFTYDARFAERDGLSFTTPVATAAVVLSGPANLHLRTVAHAREAMWAINLCDVAPDGTSTVLTNGALLSSRRAVDDELSTFAPNGDYLTAHHPLTRAALLPVVPGEPTTLDIGLLSTEAVIEVGHRLRIDVYAADAPRFVPILPDLLRTRWRAQDVILDPEVPCFLTLPLLGDPGW
ncbi:CocE/NonD family hydrolase [Actinomycetes bacterium M1A6_2h]